MAEAQALHPATTEVQEVHQATIEAPVLQQVTEAADQYPETATATRGATVLQAIADQQLHPAIRQGVLQAITAEALHQAATGVPAAHPEVTGVPEVLQAATAEALLQAAMEVHHPVAIAGAVLLHPLMVEVHQALALVADTQDPVAVQAADTEDKLLRSII